MRTASMFVSGLLLVAANAAMAASADYYMTFKAVELDPGGPMYIKAHSSGDLDGDGLADDVVIRMECAAGVMHTAQYPGRQPARLCLRPGQRQADAQAVHDREGMGSGHTPADGDEGQL